MKEYEFGFKSRIDAIILYRKSFKYNPDESLKRSPFNMVVAVVCNTLPQKVPKVNFENNLLVFTFST